MKYSIPGISVLFLAFFSLQGLAVDIYECVDAQGVRLYQEMSCPEGTTTVKVKKSASSRSETASTPDIDVVLFTIPECGACDDVRDFFRLRDIEVTDNDVSEDLDLQNDLRELTGQLSVPVAVIEDEVIIGYQRNQLEAALSAAGYVMPGEEEETP